MKLSCEKSSMFFPRNICQAQLFIVFFGCTCTNQLVLNRNVEKSCLYELSSTGPNKPVWVSALFCNWSTMTTSANTTPCNIRMYWLSFSIASYEKLPQIAKFTGPTWGPSGADRTQDPYIHFTKTHMIQKHWPMQTISFICRYYNF